MSRSADASRAETRTVVGRPADVDALDPRRAQVGAIIGRYVVLEEVGRGGMGRVLRAYDPKLQREVALKELQRNSLGSAGTQRLVAEARAMAKLSHPNVVAVYDIEALEDERLVLAMEYVAGQTLRAWLRQTQRSPKEVVARFVEAGRGLAAAHAAGLLHRDFKPANVLVADDAVKVTDFGLAKADAGTPSSADGSPEVVSQEPFEGSTALTEAGCVMGTPRYMAPEQHRSEALAPSVDQYAFCVALWEALCGQPPFAGDDLAGLKDKGPPPWPNASVARPIADAVRRGLAAKPGERWPSMEPLLAELAYDPEKRRKRWRQALGGVGALGLLAAGWHSAGVAQAQRCAGAKAQLDGAWGEGRRAQVHAAVIGTGASYAERVWQRTQTELDGYSTAWAAMHTDACEATTIRGEQSTAVMDLRMACLHHAKVDLEAVTGVLAAADTKVVNKAHELVGGLRPLPRCADIVALQAEVEPPLAEEADAVESVRARLAEARAQRKAGRYAAAHANVERARHGLTSVEYGPVHTEAALATGGVLEDLGQYDEAEAALQEALALAARWRQWDELRDVATALLYLVGDRRQRMEEGLRYRGLAQELARGNPRAQAGVHNNLANVMFAQGKYAEAEAEHRRALALRVEVLGVEHPDVAVSRNNLANVLDAQGRSAEAEVEHRRALAVRLEAFGAAHPDVAISRQNLANALDAQGKYAESEAEQRRALASRLEALGPEHLAVAASRNNLSGTLYAQGKYAESAAEQRQALALRLKALGPEHPKVAASRSNLGSILYAQGKYGESEAEQRGALALQLEALGTSHPKVAVSRNNLALVLRAQGKYADAEAEQRQALTVWLETVGPEHPHVAEARHNLAVILLARGESREAAALAEQAWTRQQQGDAPAEERAQTAFVLARALWTKGADAAQRARARALADRAIEAYRRAQRAGANADAHAAALEKIRGWLATREGPRAPASF